MSMMTRSKQFRREDCGTWLSESEINRLKPENKTTMHKTKMRMTKPTNTQLIAKVATELKRNYQVLYSVKPQTTELVRARQHVSAATRYAEDWVAKQAYPKSRYPRK